MTPVNPVSIFIIEDKEVTAKKKNQQGPSGRRPFYPLEEVKEKIQSGQYRVNTNALRSARDDFNFSLSDIKDTMLNLKENQFFKNGESQMRTEVNDIYKTSYDGERIYLHFYIRDEDPENLVINSFKEL